jgi:hypothetical protein
MPTSTFNGLAFETIMCFYEHNTCFAKCIS